MRFKYYTFAALLIIFYIIGFIPIVLGYNQHPMTLKINNPTSFNIDLELKCNWNKQEKRWLYWDIKTLYGNKNIEFNLPNKGHCQIWPKIR